MSESGHPPRPAGTWRLGRLGDTAVLARPSLLLMGVVLVLVFAPRFDGGSVNPYLLGAIFVVGLYLSVFVHELAHLVLAKAHGMRAPSITLHLMGGETAIEGESRTPWQELSTAIVGPIASAVVALIAWLAASVAGSGLAGDVLLALAWVNLLVALFNLVPGLPLDGGRVMRSLVWAITRREAVGIRVAAWIGLVTAAALVASVIVFRAKLGSSWLMDLLLAAIVAFVLWTGAMEALQHADRTARINRLDLARLVVPSDRPAHELPADLPTLPADLHGSVLLRAMAVRPAPTYAVVDHEGQLVGLLHSDDVDDAYRRST